MTDPKPIPRRRPRPAAGVGVAAAHRRPGRHRPPLPAARQLCLYRASSCPPSPAGPGRRARRAVPRTLHQPQQLHRFAHEPSEARAILAIALDPFVDQVLGILGQLPAELHPIVLAEAALAVRLGDGRIPPATDPLGGGEGQ